MKISAIVTEARGIMASVGTVPGSTIDREERYTAAINETAKAIIAGPHDHSSVAEPNRQARKNARTRKIAEIIR
jgi:hypothetical protein